MSNVKDVDLARHAWDTPPFLLIVSPTPPVQSVDAYVRTLGQSRDNQTKRGWPYSTSMGLCPTLASCCVGAPLEDDTVCRRFRNTTFYYFHLLTVGVLLAISYRYVASFPRSIRSFYGKELSSALSFKWLKEVIASLIIFTSTTQFHPSKRLIIIKRMNIKKDEKEKKRKLGYKRGKTQGTTEARIPVKHLKSWALKRYLK